MPISVECKNCGSRSRFPDAKAGRMSRCKACGEPIKIRSRRKSKKKQSSNNGLIIGIAVAAVLLIGVGGFLFLFNQDVDPPRQDDRMAIDQEAGTADRLPETNQTQTTDPPPSNSVSSNSSSSQSGFEPVETKPDPVDELIFSKSASWSVQPDPYAASQSFEIGKLRPIKLDKNLLRNSGVVFPESPSPLVATLSGSGSKMKYTIYDVESGKEVTECPAPGSLTVAALSGDGSYLAATLAGNQKIVVHDLKNGKPLGILTTTPEGKFQVSQLAIWNNRLVALSDVHHGIRVWDLPSGTLKHEIDTGDKFYPSTGHCFSPGGTYTCLIGDYLEKRLEVYNLESGQLVGSITPEGSIKVNELEAVGFSRDGTQLAAVYGIDLYGSPSRKYSRMVIWDLASGNTSADFELDSRLKEQLDPVYRSHTLESIPGGNRWLVHSLGIIDATFGKLIYSFPKQKGVDFLPSRRVIGSNSILAAISDKGDPRIEATTISEDQLLSGIESANAGGLPSDANMPPLTPSDFQQADDAIVQNQWSVTADPLVAQTPTSSLRIKTPGTARDIALSRSATPIIAIRAGIDEDLSDPEIANEETYRKVYEERGLKYKPKHPVAKESELLVFSNDGSPVTDFRVPFSAQLRGISPNGKLVLLEQHRTNGRLDLYDVETGEHRVGWRPFRAESDEKHREIKTASFVDDDHVVTLSVNQQLVVWKLPGIEPIWKLRESQDVAISPGGKFVAVVQGNSVRAKTLAIMDARNGDGLGAIEIDGIVKSIAFHPSGQYLAMSIDASANKLIRIVDIEAGQVAEEFPVPESASSLSWTGQDFLLLDGTQLVSRSLQSVVWSYDSEHVGLPDFQVSEQFSYLSVKSRPVFHTVSVPSEKVAAKLDPDRLADQAILAPGDGVNLVFKVDSNSLLSPLKNSQEDISSQLKAAKATVDSNAKVSLNVNVSTISEGSTNLTKMGDRSVSIPVTRKAITIDFSYNQAGKEIWKTTRKVTNLDRIIVRLKPDQSAQEAIDDLMVNSAESVLSSIKLPSYIFKEGAGQGLGTSSLTE